MKESNVSNLTRTFAVLSLLAPASAYPLGIGEIKLHSALNQNLDAEISLMLSGGERISDVKVSLAPPDKFDERGVPWSYFLSSISFEPSVRPDGSAVIKVRSREALKEPILDLLLQVTWPKGTSYRQFSLMVDPPAAYVQPVVPVTRVPATIASAPAIPAPVVPRTPSSYIPEPRPVVPDSVAMAPKPVRRAPKDDIVKGVYGPTRRNDTLWAIAEKASRPYKVSVEQMMIAIYQANPGAFYKDNVNALQARVKLKIPERDAVVKLSRQEALDEYNRQRDAWKNRSQPVSVAAAEAVQKKEAPVEKPVENQLTLAAPAEATVAEKAVITPGQEQNAAKSEASKAEAGAGASKPNEEMQERMAALEQQLAKMQAILAIKEQQLAALQNQVQLAPKTPVAPAQPLPAESAAPPVQQPQPSPAAAPQPTAAEGHPVKPEPSAVAQEQPSPQPLPTSKATAAAKPAAVKKPASRPAPVPEPVEEPLPLELIGFGGAGAGVMALLGFFWWRRRKMASEASLNTESMFSPSIIYKAPESESTFSVPIVNENAAYDVNPVGESSFLSEFTPSDFDAFDSDQGEIDPISEADVYLAYGRYQQAEELMRNAVASYPERDECKLKLLEIYYAAENKAGFEAFAKELSEAGKAQDSVFWEKVSEMGREICPDSAMFSLQSTQSSSPDSSVAGQSEPVNFAKQNAHGQNDFDMPSFDADFDLAAFDTPAFDTSFTKNNEPAPASTPVADPAFTDFDLEGFSLEQTVEQDESRNNASIDFDLDKLGDSTGESEVQESRAKSADLQFPADSREFDFESLDFDTGFGASDKNKKDDGTLALDQFNLTAEPADDKQGIALGDDFNFDFDFSTVGNDESEDDQIEITGLGDLTDMDELETKLDLARAYRDMGDNESARDIVSEVLEKGSAEQKKLARVLLDELM